jgi:glycosyltransferase involved in cell wall biosynthesis
MNRPLRFCMITTFYPPFCFGGDGILVYHLSNALAQLGHQVDVIHCFDSFRLLADSIPEEPQINHPNVTTHNLKSPLGFLSPLATHQTGLPLLKSKKIRKILEKGFDVIHYHNISLVGGPAVVRLGEGIKLYTMHEYWLVCPMHVLFRFNRAECKQRSCFLCSLSYKRPPQLWRYFKSLDRIKRHVDMFIAPSRFCMEKHQEMGFNVSFAPIHNFVPLPENASGKIDRDVSKTEQPRYFLFVGRLEKIKGLQTLIPLFRRYTKAELWIAGKGRYEAKLKRLAKDIGNIRFLGYQQGQNLDALYRQAVAVIIPSLCYEISSMVIPEAFTHRTPVIARKLGGMPEIIQESSAGILFETENELLHAIDTLVEKPTYRQELGECGYKAYLQNWSTQAHLKQYFELIGNIAKKKLKRSSHQLGEYP